MYLKKLQLKGFKSFANKTVLSFQKGTTAIVGPNGCGKSNIADAFRWVLGEQSAKSMRGGKMTDIIFAGTAERNPMDFAEVTITIADIHGAIPTEEDELTITRRLHRSGESDYFFNDKLVRLKDVQDLFLDSGIGKNSFSIFEQGKIEQVINFTPQERRYIFEEASGISRFLQRKRETLRKLEQTDANILRAKDIHGEIEKRMVVLSKQSAEAEIFKGLKIKVQSTEVKLILAKVKQIDKKKMDAQHKNEGFNKLLEKSQQSIAVTEKQKQNSLSLLDDQEQALKIKSEEHFKIRNEFELAQREIKNSEERFKDSHQKATRWQEELESSKKQKEQSEKDKKQALKQIEEVQTNSTSLKSHHDAEKDNLFLIEKEVAQLSLEQKKAQQEQLKLLQEKSYLESECKQNNVRLEATVDRQKVLLEKKNKLTASEQELQLQFKDKNKTVCERTAEIEKQRQRFVQLEASSRQTGDVITQLQSACDLLAKDLFGHQSRLKLLTRLRDDFEGFSSASKQLLKESADSHSPLFGKLKGLYEWFKTDPQHQNAVASCLNRYSQSLVVETQQDAEAICAFAQTHQLTDFSLIVIESLVPLAATTPSSSLLAFVDQNNLSGHFLKSIAIADSLQSGLELRSRDPHLEIWCSDTTYIDHKGVFFYGLQGKNNAFLREAEIRTLENEIVQIESEKLSKDKALERELQIRADLHKEIVELDKIIRRNEMHLVEENFSLQRLKADLEKSQKDAQHTSEELILLETTTLKLQDLIQNLQTRLEETNKSLTQCESSLQIREKEYQHQHQRMTAQRKTLQDLDVSCRSTVELLQKSEHALQVLELQEKEHERNQKRLREELAQAAAIQIELKNTIRKNENGLKILQERVLAVDEEAKKLESYVKTSKAQIIEIEKTMAQHLEQRRKVENDQQQVQLVLAQLEATRTGHEEELVDRHQISLIEASAKFTENNETIDLLEKTLREQRRQLESLGDVNLTSIEECKQQQERYEFFNTQLEDLSVSKKSLLQIIGDLDSECRKLFQETFLIISQNFKKNFSILFNGGEAELQFTDSNDPLEAGIEIIAKPPGKQMRSISLLSGGEKCLTALALLFAIFEVKAAPFCILDEIDAPLDDSNVERFAELVKQFKDYCQFIVITHNKQTMAVADLLFGVSMEERGVSTLLELEFSTAGTIS